MTVPYIINAALLLGACLAFYKVLLRRETFYRVNRFLLVACLALAFMLPLLTIPAEFSLREVKRETSNMKGEWSKVNGQWPMVNEGKVSAAPGTDLNPVTKTIAPASTYARPLQRLDGVINPLSLDYMDAQEKGSSISWSQVFSWMILLYWFGVAVFGASFLFQLFILCWRSFRNPVIIDGRYRIVEMSGDQAPCSFGNTIFINPSNYDAETYQQILLHEKIHISQRHTIDILLAELVLVFQWFNPFAWIYRREIENNLEYLTDDQLVQHPAIDKRAYQFSLLKVAAPHLPLGLTSNYNQSTLKKRIAMMNSKRSSLHTAWKYFFLLPVLIFLICLLNEPGIVKAQNPNKTAGNTNISINDPGTEGYWFAVIDGDEVNIRFSDEKLDKEDDLKDGQKKGRNFSSNSFKLSELGNYPKGTSGTFFVTREAGKMEFTGKFEGKTGMGTYKYVADKNYAAYMNKELGEKLDEEEQMAFFLIDIKMDYLKMLRNEGFAKVTKDDIIPMAAMNIDAAYIRSIKTAGYKDVTMEELIPLKALGVDAAYIREISESGIRNVDLDKLISFKAQGIGKEDISKMKNLKGKEGKDLDEDDADDLVSFKAMGIDEEFIRSFKATGLDVPHDELVAFKAVGVTPEYVRSWRDAGFRDIDAEDYVGMKSQNVTPEYYKSFVDLGLKDIKPGDLVGFRALGVTAEYIKSWHDAGFKNIDADDFAGMRSQNVTPEYYKSFIDLGFKDVKPEDLVGFRALGVTPEYVKSWRDAGYKDLDMDDIPGLKSQNVTPEFIRSFEEVGLKITDIEDAISAKVMGVTPAYIKEMRAKGLNYNKLEKYVQLKAID